MSKQKLTQTAIIEEVAKWPKESQLDLIRALLYQLGPDEAELRSPLPRATTYDRAAGLLNTGQHVPDDAEVERIIRERRTEKYG